MARRRSSMLRSRQSRTSALIGAAMLNGNDAVTPQNERTYCDPFEIVAAQGASFRKRGASGDWRRPSARG
jgi:hypothetical protein